MTPFQYVLLKLKEESAEVIQEASKVSQFGYDSISPKTNISGREALHKELDDLLGCITLLNREYGLDWTPSHEATENKINKIKQYMDYSVKEGYVIR